MKTKFLLLAGIAMVGLNNLQAAEQAAVAAAAVQERVTQEQRAHEAKMAEWGGHPAAWLGIQVSMKTAKERYGRIEANDFTIGMTKAAKLLREGKLPTIMPPHVWKLKQAGKVETSCVCNTPTITFTLENGEVIEVTSDYYKEQFNLLREVGKN